MQKTWVWPLFREDCTCRGVTKPLHLTIEPELQSPGTIATEACVRRSMVYFELSKWTEILLFFFFWHMDIQLFQHHFWKDHPFSKELLWHLFQKSIDHICVSLSLDSLYCSFDLFMSMVSHRVGYNWSDLAAVASSLQCHTKTFYSLEIK